MGVHKRPPVFVPAAHRAEVMKLSKAALADMAWDYAQQLSRLDGDEGTMAEFRERREIILNYRDEAQHSLRLVAPDK